MYPLIKDSTICTATKDRQNFQFFLLFSTHSYFKCLFSTIADAVLQRSHNGPDNGQRDSQQFFWKSQNKSQGKDVLCDLIW